MAMELEERQFGAYTIITPSDIVTDANPESTTSPVVSTTTKHTTDTKTSARTGTKTTATSSVPTSTSTSMPGLHFKFVELFDQKDSSYYSIHEDQFFNSSFSLLCPSGNCITDCQDYPRLFSAIPSGISQDVATYGRPDAYQKLQVTLFGVCSNLGNATAFAQAQDPSSVVRRAFRGDQLVGVPERPDHEGREHDRVLLREHVLSRRATRMCATRRAPRRSCSRLARRAAASTSPEKLITCVQQLCENTCALAVRGPEMCWGSGCW